LKNIRNHLAPHGKFILNFFFPNPEIIVKNIGKEPKETIKTKNKKYIRIDRSYFIDEPN